MEGISLEFTLVKQNSEKLDQARKYVKDNMMKVINQPHRNNYHVMPEVGWINDPNGFSVYKDEYHLFYQYYPYATHWGPMHWGHVKSKDLIKWEYLPVALAPDQKYDANGCFSGSAIQVNDKHILMYTGHVDPKMSFTGTSASDAGEVRQVQCLAVGDGVNYHKLVHNPIISTEMIPANSSLSDFRDPKIWEKNGMYYCVVGCRDSDESGKIAMYQSANLVDWAFVGILDHSQHELGRMWECPDVFELDQRDVLIMSPQELHDEDFRHKNGNSTVFFVGKLDYETGKFDKVSFDEIDYGLDFYAPQTTLAPDGRRIMIAWMQSWDRNIPSDQYGWAGSMTLPRELKVINNLLYQIPVKEIENYRQNEISYKDIPVSKSIQLDGINGRCLELEMTVDFTQANQFSLKLMKNKACETVISFDKESSILKFDRSHSQSGINQADPKDMREVPVLLKDSQLKLRIFIDTYSVEIFAQDGQYTMTSTVYSDLDAKEIEFAAEGEAIVSVSKWELQI